MTASSPPHFPPSPERSSDPGILGRGQRVIAVGGGRGGVGKSLLSVNLGVYFAQLGRSVVLCDADPHGSNLHSVLGLERPPLTREDNPGEPAGKPVATSVPGLSLLPTSFDPFTSAPVKANRRSHWASRLSKLTADYVILHLGASAAAPTLDLFRGADVSLCVAAPDPLAVETTYGFLRALFLRVLRRRLAKERFKLKVVERVLLSLTPPASPREIIGGLRRIDPSIANTAARELARMAPRLVVGQTRLRSDLELGPAMCTVSERFLGIGLDYLGHVEHDDAVWLTVRRRSPLLIDSPTSKSARNIERVARRILALLAARHDPRHEAAQIAGLEAPLTLYEALGVSRSAADDEIRRAYKRQREVFREGSFPIISVVPPEKLKEEQARIEEAYDTLLDPVRRRAYDQSVFPEERSQQIAPKRTANAAAAAERALLQAELAREIHAETQFTGELLKKVRESQGVEIADIAQRTKISTMHLAALETETLNDLPALVYVQGFVQEVAKYLKLDPTQVAKTYMRRLRQRATEDDAL